MEELTNVLTHANLRLPEREVGRLFRLLDANGNGKITYTEFCDVIDQKAVPDYLAFVTKDRAQQKTTDAANASKAAIAANIKSIGGEVGSSEFSRDEKLGKIAGLSSIMDRSVHEDKVMPLLIDDGDSLRIQEEIKELLRTGPTGKPTTFDDLLQLMGAAKFQKEG
jgi:hypothetical protein